jgi:uncharacterized ion transporter superfamily protein YfcC
VCPKLGPTAPSCTLYFTAVITTYFILITLVNIFIDIYLGNVQNNHQHERQIDEEFLSQDESLMNKALIIVTAKIK